MVNVESRRVVDFQIVQKIITSGRGNHQGSTNEIEVETRRRIVKGWEDDHKVAVAVTDQDSKMTKAIRESRSNVRHEYDVNHAKKTLDCHCQGLPKEKRRFCTGSRSALETRAITPDINVSPVTRRLKCGRTRSITIAATIPNVAIQ
jgi:hypothetical protein